MDYVDQLAGNILEAYGGGSVCIVKIDFDRAVTFAFELNVYPDTVIKIPIHQELFYVENLGDLIFEKFRKEILALPALPIPENIILGYN